MMTKHLKLEAKARLVGSSILDADVDEDSRKIVEEQAEGAKQGLGEADAVGDPEAEDRYKALMDEMDTALADPGTLTANDTSDFPGLTVADPTLESWHHDTPAGTGDDQSAVDEQMLMKEVLPEGVASLNASLFDEEERQELVLIHAGFFTKDDARAAFATYKAEQEAIAGRALTTEELIAISASGSGNYESLESSTEDPVGDGEAFDMLVDGDPSQEEPVVQELTNNDGSMELPEDQALLRDDVSAGPPTL